MAWKDFEHGGSGWDTTAVGGPGTRDIVGAGARGCSIMGSSEEFFFFIVLVVCSDTYRSFGIPPEYLFLVRKIFPSELS